MVLIKIPTFPLSFVMGPKSSIGLDSMPFVLALSQCKDATMTEGKMSSGEMVSQVMDHADPIATWLLDNPLKDLAVASHQTSLNAVVAG
jgi:hypothetical protein